MKSIKIITPGSCHKIAAANVGGLLCALICACSGPGVRTYANDTVPAAALAATAKIRVSASDFRNDKGIALVRLFASADGFPGNARKALMKAEVAISSRSAKAEFTALQPGVYAVSIAHDEDGSGALTYNLIGIPLEGSGSSGKPRNGPPRFEDAKFELAEGGTKEIVIAVRYFG